MAEFATSSIVTSMGSSSSSSGEMVSSDYMHVLVNVGKIRENTHYRLLSRLTGRSLAFSVHGNSNGRR